MSKHKHHHRLDNPMKALHHARQQGIGPLHGRAYDYRLKKKSAAPECDQHPETAKGGEIETSSAAILPEPKGDCKE